jgi:hypothetical protein
MKGVVQLQQASLETGWGLNAKPALNRHKASRKQVKNSAESAPNLDKNARNHRIPAKRANSLLKYSALWTQPCCRRPASPRRRRRIDVTRDAKRHRDAARRR